MIGQLNTPWRDGETDRYEPCGRHAGALDRMDYDEAWDCAAKCCDGCVAEVRPVTEMAPEPAPHDYRARFCKERLPREWEPGYRCPVCERVTSLDSTGTFCEHGHHFQDPEPCPGCWPKTTPSPRSPRE
jgi:hypothetical protein